MCRSGLGAADFTKYPPIYPSEPSRYSPGETQGSPQALRFEC
jgi:hypothetical protein